MHRCAVGRWVLRPFLYPDLMRRCLAWLMDVETPLWFEGLDLAASADGGKQTWQVAARQASPQKGAALRFRLFPSTRPA